MKKILLTTVVTILAFNLFSQVKIGLRGGFASAAAQTSDVILSNNDTLGLSDLKGGMHFGLFTQFRIKKFFIQPEILFNSSTAEYTLKQVGNSEGRKEIISDRYNYLDVPVMMGAKFGSLRLQAGPVGHVNLDNKSDLLKKEGFRNAFENLTYGYQAGIGLDLWKLVLDLKYEGNFTDFDDFIQFENMNVDLADSPSRWVFSVGYSF